MKMVTKRLPYLPSVGFNKLCFQSLLTEARGGSPRGEPFSGVGLFKTASDTELGGTRGVNG